MPSHGDGLINVYLGGVYVGSYAWTIAAVGWLNIVCANKVNSDYECDNYAENGALFNAISPVPEYEVIC
ncbi:MAG: hypothetical protein ABSF44_11075 [Candidatus Bathyarchaeia archaeon]